MSAPDSEEDLKLYGAVYAALLLLTGATVASYWFGFAPLLGVVLALGIACAKAGLIAAYFMHLRREGVVILGIVFAGILAVLTLVLGLMPDMALRLP